MTVAATILATTAAEALADTLGQPRVRRLVDIAWSGGALPVVVLSPDADGAVARALIGSEAIHGLPTDAANGPARQAAELAAAEVHETTAILVWPARMTWVGPETVTSLIEAHGTNPDTVLRPAWHGEPGWPVLVPTDRLGAIDPELAPEAAVAALAAAHPTRDIELGDPGVTHDIGTSRDALPPYEGPPDPPAGHTHEWGEDVEAEADLRSPDAAPPG